MPRAVAREAVVSDRIGGPTAFRTRLHSGAHQKGAANGEYMRAAGRHKKSRVA